MRPNTASNSITAIAGARSNDGQSDESYESRNRIALPLALHWPLHTIEQ